MTVPEKTQVGIIGAGPAGLMLAHLLHLYGIESVILEAKSEEYVLGRVRAGVLDNDVADLFIATGVGERMQKSGLTQTRMEFRFNGQSRVMNWSELAGGRRNVVYGQQEVVKDLIAKRRELGGHLYFDTPVVGVSNLTQGKPRITYEYQGQTRELECELVAGCDGYHGVARQSIPKTAITEHERRYPFAWMGILAAVPPSREWLISASHDRGFALHSMRSRQVTRLYIQIPPEDTEADWPDERIWDELDIRLALDGWTLNRGPVFQKGKVDLRSFVCEPMQYGSLFLAGDSAHVVPPTGGRGMNQAISDVAVLADAMNAYFNGSNRTLLDRYSAKCLRRVWRAQYFTNRMTGMLQRRDFTDTYTRRLQIAELDLVTSDPKAAAELAQHYTGEPLESDFLPNDRKSLVTLQTGA